MLWSQRLPERDSSVFLTRLVNDRVPLPQALGRIASLHARSPQQVLPLRQGFVSAGGRFFPHPADVPPLVVFLFHRLDALWGESINADDDFRIATLAMYGVLAIHPFENGNGRTAVDFMQLLLMHRAASPRSLLSLPAEAHRLLGGVLAPLDEPCDGQSGAAFISLQRGLARRLAAANMGWLRREPAFSVITTWLRHQVR